MTSGERTWPARTVAVLGALGWGVGFFGVVDLAVVPLQDERYASYYLLETGWGLLFTVLVAVPLAALARRPSTPAHVLQVLAVAVSVALASVLASYPEQLLPAAGLAVTGILAGVLAGARLTQVPGRASVALLALAVVAAPSAITYAVDQAHRDPLLPPDLTWGLDHRPMQAGVALAVLAVALLAATLVGRVPGGRLSAWTAAVTAAWFGAVSALYPDTEASLGRVEGLCAIGWGVLFVLVAEVVVLRSRRIRRPARAH